jgi:hypothetical protein
MHFQHQINNEFIITSLSTCQEQPNFARGDAKLQPLDGATSLYLSYQASP